MNSSFTIGITAVGLVIILLGVIVGAVRGFSRSFTRTIMALVSAVLAFFLSAKLASALLVMDISSLGINIGGSIVYNLQDMLLSFLNQITFIKELALTSSTFNAFVVQLPLMIINIVVFLLLFFIIKYLSMFIYWIIWGVFFRAKKSATGTALKTRKHWITGGILGGVNALITLLILLIPMFGIVSVFDIADKAIQSAPQKVVGASYSSVTGETLTNMIETTPPETTPPAVQPSTPPPPALTVNQVITQVGKYVNEFRENGFIKLFSAVHLDQLSVVAFDDLTTVKVLSEKITLKNEIVSVGKIYSQIDTIKAISTSPTAEDFTSLQYVINSAFESTIFSKVIEDIVPKLAVAWTDSVNTTFLGIARPAIADENASLLFDEFLKSLIPSTRLTLKSDLLTFVSVGTVISNPSNNLLDAIVKGGDVLTCVTTGNVIQDLILEMSKSPTFKKVIPEVVNFGLKTAYKSMGIVLTPENKNNLTTSVDGTKVNWNDEAVKVQSIIQKAYNASITFKGVTSIDQLEDAKLIELGEAFNSLRDSALFGSISKNIIVEMLSQFGSVPPEIVTVMRNSDTSKINYSVMFVDIKTSLVKVTAAINTISTAITNGFKNADVKAVIDSVTTGGGLPESIIDVASAYIESNPELNKSPEVGAIISTLDVLKVDKGTPEEKAQKLLEFKNSVGTTLDVMTNSTILVDAMKEVKLPTDVISSEVKAVIAESITAKSDLTENEKNALKNFFNII
ncbi:MAG: hypothetical protein RR334_02710 [Clostridia bacterium]